MTSITVLLPTPVAMPRGARAAAWLISRAIDAIDAIAARRGTSFSIPERVRQAAEARRFARQIEQQDPRFAADLYAAADRHEIE